MPFDIATADATIHSEELEPIAQYLIGRWFVQVEQAKLLVDDPHRHVKLERAWSNFWRGLYGLEKVAFACDDAIHFRLVIGNTRRKIAGLIQEELGVDVFKEPGWSR